MRIQWYGHSSFRITGDEGPRIFTDPCNASTGCRLSGIEADIVTISHVHKNHAYLQTFTNTPVSVLREPGIYEVAGCHITGIESYHNDSHGKRAGNNTIFVFEMDGLRAAHLGDLGGMLDDETFEVLGKLDVLLAPVGGIYTIGPHEACTIAERTSARIFIPMHFQTGAINADPPMLGLDALLSVAKDWRVHKLNQSEAVVTRDNLGERRLLVLDYEKMVGCTPIGQ